MLLSLGHQTGNLLNINELSSTLSLSTRTIENYLYVLGKCFHTHLLKPFHNNIRKELTKMPKIYFNDIGLRNILLNQFNPIWQRSDRGQLIENFTFVRLRNRFGTDNLRFWRTADGHEVDFIIKNTINSGEAIEIKYNISSFNPKKYKKFTQLYPAYNLSCKAYETEGNISYFVRLQRIYRYLFHNSAMRKTGFVRYAGTFIQRISNF